MPDRLSLGQRVLEDMDGGRAPHEALEGALRRDSQAESRQLIASTTSSGSETMPWALMEVRRVPW
jgi:uncharacterized Ntn-hydrolase superfamily protein